MEFYLKYDGPLESNAGAKDKQPFFCLLEDDKLVTSVNVRTHTLLCIGLLDSRFRGNDN
jgi:hypothetical protein